MTVSPQAISGRIDQYWSLLADLPLRIEDATTEGLVLAGGSMSFERRTTLIKLHGDGHIGCGENVCYHPDTHDYIPDVIASLPLAGTYTLQTFSQRLGALQLVPERGSEWNDHPNFHRWAIESAAVDLALRQAGISLGSVLGRTPHDVSFCLSMGLGDPPSLERVRGWLAVRPSTTLKLDVSSAWPREFFTELGASGAVRVIDCKGHYSGDWFNNAPVPATYQLIATELPGVFIEDPMLTSATRAALGAAGVARTAWDAPIHSLADAQSFAAQDPPAAFNMKPSRFGTMQQVLAVIEWCEQSAVPVYGGGQFELGYGRTQLQQLASLFYPDADNDTAPVIFHRAVPGDDVPSSPLQVPHDQPGFGWGA